MDRRAFIANEIPTLQDWQTALELVKQDGVDDLIIVITKSKFNDGDECSPEFNDCFFVDADGNRTSNTDFHGKFLKMFAEWFEGRGDRYGYEAPRIPSVHGDWDDGIAYWLYNKCDRTLDGDWWYVQHKISLKTLTYLGAIKENESR